MYSGSIALKQGLEILLEAAAMVQDQPEIQFVIIGEGPPLASLKSHAVRMNIENVRFLPFQPRGNLPEQLGAADALVITQKHAVTDIVFPGKLLYYMAAARPIIAAVSAESETGRFVATHHIGIITPPDDAAALAKSIRTLAIQNPISMGQWGRVIVERMFDEKVVLPAFAEVLESICQAAGPHLEQRTSM